MKIQFIDIQNFRKLKSSRINLSDEDTLLVGANNSGKTSAMDALINFLDHKSKSNIVDEDNVSKHRFSTTDFTLSNWSKLNGFARSWMNDDLNQGDKLLQWQALCPSIDIWLNVSIEEVHLVSHLIPTLKWNGGLLGVRLIYQPKKIENLREQFMSEFDAVKTLLNHPDVNDSSDGGQKGKLTLWPRDMREFLDKRLNSLFDVKAYILDPSKLDVNPQLIQEESLPLDHYPFNGLFKVDIIEAQRGFFDPNSSNGTAKASGSLSAQLNKYYTRHLNPTDQPDAKDITALQAIDTAKVSFDERLNESFEDALDEIKGLGYPGFNDPEIKLSSKVNPVESLDHDAAVIFDITKYGKDNSELISLPEKYNGLGYKNLIYIVFKLISFRDRWMRIGKASRKRTEKDIAIEPLHLVLIEEPEAHLHAQVQQVFVRKAYGVLRKGIGDDFSTQMIVSSHSSYIAQEVGFKKLRYFKRKPASSEQIVPSAEVVDLSLVFSTSKKSEDEEERIKETAKFVTRYLKTTHCDLFFANGVIIVEGAAERMLLPHFIRAHYNRQQGLNSSYISILEIGGAHAHRLRPLIESLGLPTLIITDTDALNDKGKKTLPLRNEKYRSGSDTLKDWFDLKNKTLVQIIDLKTEQKIRDKIRVAYQCGIEVKYSEKEEIQEAIPYTFEDAIALTNIELFRLLEKPTGMVKKMQNAAAKDTLDECCKELYDCLKGDKAKMALDLLFDVAPEGLKMPLYIKEGLDWLESELDIAGQDFISAEETSLKEIEDVK